MQDKSLTYEAGCTETLGFLRSIEGKMRGSAYNRMLMFRQMTATGGEIDQLIDKLVRIIGANEQEAAIEDARPKGAILALGHLDVAKQLLHETVKATDNVHAALDDSSDKAVVHLKEAIRAVER